MMNVPRISGRQLVLKTRRERQLGHLVGFEHLGEGRRFDQLEADIEADDDHHGAEQERHAPAPGHEGGRVKDVAGHQEDHVGDDEADGRAQLRERAVDGALVRGGVLGGQQGRAAPFAAEGKALGEAHDHQQGRGPECPARNEGGGQAADQEGGNAHGQQRGHQGALAAELVTEVAKDDRPQRPGDESDAEDCEGAQQLRWFRSGRGRTARGKPAPRRWRRRRSRRTQRWCRSGWRRSRARASSPAWLTPAAVLWQWMTCSNTFVRTGPAPPKGGPAEGYRDFNISSRSPLNGQKVQNADIFCRLKLAPPHSLTPSKAR